MVYTKITHSNVYLPKIIFISPEDSHLSSLRSTSSWGHGHPASAAIPWALAGLPGAALAHPGQPRCLAGARWGEHRGVFNAQLYVEKPRGQYHTVVLGEGFLDGITILDCVNANPGFICKRKAS